MIDKTCLVSWEWSQTFFLDERKILVIWTLLVYNAGYIRSRCLSGEWEFAILFTIKLALNTNEC